MIYYPENSDVDESNSGDLHKPRRIKNTAYRIRVSADVVNPPTVEELRLFALDHYALKLLGGYIARGADPRNN